MSPPTRTATRSTRRRIRSPKWRRRWKRKFGEPRKAALVWRPQNNLSVDDEQGEKLLRLIEALEESDDVQNVYANFEVSDALVAEDERLAKRFPAKWEPVRRRKRVNAKSQRSQRSNSGIPKIADMMITT